MTIEEKIIEPLQRYIDGADGLFRFPMTQAAREVVRYGDASGLHRQMEPFYEMWIEDSPRLDWTSRSIIGDIAQIDPLFGAWASRQDLMKMARAWAVRGDGEGMLTLLYCVIHSKNYEPYCGESTYEEVTEELRYQRVNGNSSSGEIYMHRGTDPVCIRRNDVRDDEDVTWMMAAESSEFAPMMVTD